MIVVFIVVLVVFGPQKLPELAKGLGKLMAEFRKASTDFRSAFEEEMREMERQALQVERKKAAEAVAASVAAEPTQPSTIATPSGAETAVSESQAVTHETETPAISLVPESVPRSTEEHLEIKSKATTVTNSEDPSHDTQRPV